jgi:hypothetical protein
MQACHLMQLACPLPQLYVRPPLCKAEVGEAPCCKGADNQRLWLSISVNTEVPSLLAGAPRLLTAGGSPLTAGSSARAGCLRPPAAGG